MDQHGVAPEPAQPGSPRELALEDGAGVDVRTAAHFALQVLREPREQSLELGYDDLVVVVTARVARDHRASGIVVRVRLIEASVLVRDHQARAHVAKRPAKIRAAPHRVRASQVAHLAVAPVCDPRLEELRVRARVDGGDPREREPLREGALLQSRGGLHAARSHGASDIGGSA
jgi:hypothetical protein